MKVLFIGDIVGKIGRQAIKTLLPNLVDRYKIDMVIANGEKKLQQRFSTSGFISLQQAIISGTKKRRSRT
jgi:calcineurin-like phosphoesterase